MRKYTARVLHSSITSSEQKFKGDSPSNVFSKPNKLCVSIQSNNNKKYVTGEVKMYEWSECTLKSQCRDPQFLTLTLGKEFSVPTE